MYHSRITHDEERDHRAPSVEALAREYRRRKENGERDRRDGDGGDVQLRKRRVNEDADGENDQKREEKRSRPDNVASQRQTTIAETSTAATKSSRRTNHSHLSPPSRRITRQQSAKEEAANRAQHNHLHDDDDTEDDADDTRSPRRRTRRRRPRRGHGGGGGDDRSPDRQRSRSPTKRMLGKENHYNDNGDSPRLTHAQRGLRRRWSNGSVTREHVRERLGRSDKADDDNNHRRTVLPQHGLLMRRAGDPRLRRGESPAPSVGSATSCSSSGSDAEGHVSRSTKMIGERFEIRKQLGKGTFGRVFEAMNTHRNRVVAIKCVRKVPRYVEDALVEAKICWDVQKRPESAFHCAQILRQFEWRGHLCLVFEKLGMSLRQFLRFQRERGPLSLERVRVIGKGLTKAMAFLHSIGLTHADLKTDNVLFENDDMPFGPPVMIRVKVIDFGAATWDGEKHAQIIQTRHYRAPEVVLDNGWTVAADMWSVGCILLELFESKMTFDTHDSAEHVAMMERLMGDLPEHMIRQAGSSARGWFDRGNRLRWPEIAHDRRSIARVLKVKPLSKRLPEHCRDLADVLNGMFMLDPSRRITAVEALRMPFFRDC